MKTATRKASAPLGILLLCAIVPLPAYAAGPPMTDQSGGMSEMHFRDADTDRDGFLSLDEFKAKGKDDLSFKAADLNGDERIDPDEYEKYKAMKETDQSGSGTSGNGSAPPADMPMGD